jgi:hypothetical protein
MTHTSEALRAYHWGACHAARAVLARDQISAAVAVWHPHVALIETVCEPSHWSVLLFGRAADLPDIVELPSVAGVVEQLDLAPLPVSAEIFAMIEEHLHARP